MPCLLVVGNCAEVAACITVSHPKRALQGVAYPWVECQVLTVFGEQPVFDAAQWGLSDGSTFDPTSGQRGRRSTIQRRGNVGGGEIREGIRQPPQPSRPDA